MSLILNGKAVQEAVKARLIDEIKSLVPKPKIVIVQVGDLASSNVYIQKKKTFGESVGAEVEHRKCPELISNEDLLTIIKSFNNDGSVHGIILQIPIPKHLDKSVLIEAIDPRKDVDGLHSTNLKLLSENDPRCFIPATSKGVLSLLDHYEIPIAGKRVVIVGRSSLVGKPTALLMLNRDATVVICHSKTVDLSEETRRADILIAAAGQPRLIGPEFVSAGQTVIDVSINVSVDKGSGQALVGDVDFEKVKDIVAAISPVPGGVGPMTVASLFENLLKAYKNQK